MKKNSWKTFFVDKSSFLRYIYTMKKLTKIEMKELQAQLNEMDYNVDALARSTTIPEPGANAQVTATVCRDAAVYGD